MIKYSDLTQGTSMLSPSVLHKSDIGVAEHIPLVELLDRKLSKSDNGFDIGTASYMAKSNYFFIKAKALQNEKFTPYLDGEGTVGMNPKSFIDYKLKTGDLLISKDSNVGECVILSEDLSNYMPCGALYRLPIKKYNFYVFAYMKSKMFRSQIDALVPKGATIRHAGTKFLQCVIPFPKNGFLEKIDLVERIVKMIIAKEKQIRDNHHRINFAIEKELLQNDISPYDVNFSITKYSEILSANRIDAAYYSQKAKYQKSLLLNYKDGYKSLSQLGYKMKRGQNLQVTNIGKSVYSDIRKPNFYTVIKPTNFTDYGTVADFEYLGNKNTLQILKNGDIVFSAEGTVGKCVLFANTGENWITNIHGIVLSTIHNNVSMSAFITCILRFFREWGFYDHFTVGGQGGSLGKNYWKNILIPNFPEQLMHEIVKLYHSNYQIASTEKDILQSDTLWNENAGIIELDRSIRLMKNLLDQILSHISNERDFSVDEYYDKLLACYL